MRSCSIACQVSKAPRTRCKCPCGGQFHGRLAAGSGSANRQVHRASKRVAEQVSERHQPEGSAPLPGATAGAVEFRGGALVDIRAPTSVPEASGVFYHGLGAPKGAPSPRYSPADVDIISGWTQLVMQDPHIISRFGNGQRAVASRALRTIYDYALNLAQSARGRDSQECREGVERIGLRLEPAYELMELRERGIISRLPDVTPQTEDAASAALERLNTYLSNRYSAYILPSATPCALALCEATVRAIHKDEPVPAEAWRALRQEGTSFWHPDDVVRAFVEDAEQAGVKAKQSVSTEATQLARRSESWRNALNVAMACEDVDAGVKAALRYILPTSSIGDGLHAYRLRTAVPRDIQTEAVRWVTELVCKQPDRIDAEGIVRPLCAYVSVEEADQVLTSTLPYLSDYRVLAAIPFLSRSLSAAGRAILLDTAVVPVEQARQAVSMDQGHGPMQDGVRPPAELTVTSARICTLSIETLAPYTTDPSQVTRMFEAVEWLAPDHPYLSFQAVKKLMPWVDSTERSKWETQVQGWNWGQFASQAKQVAETPTKVDPTRRLRLLAQENTRAAIQYAARISNIEERSELLLDAAEERRQTGEYTPYCELVEAAWSAFVEAREAAAASIEGTPPDGPVAGANGTSTGRLVETGISSTRTSPILSASTTASFRL